MATRAMLTDYERGVLTGELVPERDNNRYKAIGRIRKRLDGRLTEDVAILRENYPELYEELLSSVENGREAPAPTETQDTDE